MGAFRKPVIVAMDWHDIMFYGDSAVLNNYL